MSRLVLFRLMGKSIANTQTEYCANRMTIFSLDSVRNMFTERSLRLDTFDNMRQDKRRVFDSGKDRYIERVRKYIEQGETQSVVKDDLINLIGLAETEEHLDLIEQIIPSPSLREHLTNGPWGSLLTRLYYRMNEIDRACKNIKDTEKFGDFFMQYAAFRVAMTLLFRAGRYDELIEIYNLACEKLTLNNATRQRQLDVLALAACVKMNSIESLSIAENIYTKSTAYDIRHLKSRLDSLLVYLAINLNESAKALNYLTGGRMRNNLILPTRALKTLALIKLNRFEDVVFHLRDAMQTADRMQKILPQEIVEMMREKKDDIEDENVRQELLDILVELKDNNMLDDRPLESIIFNEIETREGEQLQNQAQDFYRAPKDSNRAPKDFNRAPRDFDRGPKDFDRAPNDDHKGRPFRTRSNRV